MQKQTFKQITEVIDQFRAECDEQTIKPKRPSDLTQKYFNRLLQTAAKRGESWAS